MSWTAIWYANTSPRVLVGAAGVSGALLRPRFTVREAIDAAIRSRWLETTADSGQWPCDYANAIHVKLSQPREQPRPAPAPSSTAVREAVPAATGTLVAEADMQDFELQDLAEQVGKLMKETVGLSLHFHLRVELDPASQVSEAALAKVNGLLEEVSGKLKLREE